MFKKTEEPKKNTVRKNQSQTDLTLFSVSHVIYLKGKVKGTTI